MAAVSPAAAVVLRRPSVLARLVAQNGAWRVWTTFGLLAALVVLGLAAPLLPLADPIAPDPLATLQPPSWQHWCGTDRDGMDVLSRTVFAIRIDFSLAISSVLL